MLKDLKQVPLCQFVPQAPGSSQVGSGSVPSGPQSRGAVCHPAERGRWQGGARSLRPAEGPQLRPGSAHLRPGAVATCGPGRGSALPPETRPDPLLLSNQGHLQGWSETPGGQHLQQQEVETDQDLGPGQLHFLSHLDGTPAVSHSSHSSL